MSLVETLVVLGIMGLVLALALPAILASRESARRTQCQHHLRQLSLAISQFHAAQNRLPHGYLFGKYGKGESSLAWSWIAECLPYFEEQPQYDSGGVRVTRLKESALAGTTLAMVRCPDDDLHAIVFRDCGNLEGTPFAATNYQAVSGANWGQDRSLGIDLLPTFWRNRGTNGSFDGWEDRDGIMLRSGWRKPIRFRDVRDGLSKTAMLGESLHSANSWCCAWIYANNTHGTCAIPPNVKVYDGAPIENWDYSNAVGFHSNHPYGLNFAWADGSVHFVDEHVDLTIYRGWATIAGHERGLMP